MALAYSLLTSGSSTDNTTSYTTGLFTPPANSVLFFVIGYSIAGGPAPIPVVTSSADGITWNDLQSANQARSVSIFRRATGASPVQVAVTMTSPAGEIYTSAMWAVVAFTGADLSGNDNGLSAIAQTVVNNGNSTEATATLANPVTGGNATLFALIQPNNEDITPAAGWTEIIDIKQTGPISSTESQYRLDGAQTASATWPTAGAWRSILVEVKASAGGPATHQAAVGMVATSILTANGAVSSPTYPTGLTATPVSTSQIDLSWNAYPSAVGYDIERNGTIIVSDHVGTSYSDSGLLASTQYSYRVRAVL